MLWTPEEITVYTQENNLEPVEIKGIPSGLTFKTPKKDDFVLFGPLGKDIHHARTPNSLVSVYNSFQAN